MAAAKLTLRNVCEPLLYLDVVMPVRFLLPAIIFDQTLLEAKVAVMVPTY